MVEMRFAIGTAPDEGHDFFREGRNQRRTARSCDETGARLVVERKSLMN